MAFVIIIFTLRILLVHIALQNLEQNHEAKDYWNKVDLQWKMGLEAITTGT